ncbi:thioredoxin domain-containing protein [Tessaracoccus sp. OH4464_COT-324]|uniref:DsbA family protein n=1 Tax=Tessaracoccus sp. OH4464_COT-324 TaxID=2491059 RepID=UPI000F6394EA|nr:thioredoxin domain-containing protein [Tessaracoccus sp. OH4464_COT-324]RRD47557.1 disulfide bond formation protein [Tessaracoccus sp. OH4464_COT-324]
MKNKIQPMQIILGAVLAVLVLGSIAMLGQQGQSAAESAPPKSASAQQAGGEKSAAGTTSVAPSAKQQPTERSDQERALLALPRRKADDPAALGAVDAPVVITEWADFRCPFCSAFSEQTLPKLRSFIDSGQVRFEFRDFAVFGDDSVFAAAAARAAGRQGKQFEFMETLFIALPNSGHPPVSRDLALQVAQQVGVADLDLFAADIDGEELKAAVQAETVEAQQIGIQSVPAFVVGGQYISGAQPAEVFVQVIQEELAKAGR